MVKYDLYDPNTRIASDHIGSKAGTGAADVAYLTFGVGYIFRANSFLRLMAYYDIADNERTANLTAFADRVK